MQAVQRVQKLGLLTPKGIRPPPVAQTAVAQSSRVLTGPTPIRKTAGRKRRGHKGRKGRKTRRQTRRR
jgi:hypothetical protein